MTRNDEKVVRKVIKKQLKKGDRFGVDFGPQIGSKIDPQITQKSTPKGGGLWRKGLLILFVKSSKLSSRLHETTILLVQVGPKINCFLNLSALACMRARFSPFSFFSWFFQNPWDWALAYTRARLSPFQEGSKISLFLNFSPLACTRRRFTPFSLFLVFWQNSRNWALAYTRARL